MATITIRKEYDDGEILFGSDIDAIIEDVETFLNTTRVNDDNIQNAGITASDKLVDATVTASKLASNAVTTTKIMDANVTTVKIADANVTTAKILDANVTTAKIADSNVTTVKIADSNVTAAKLAANAVETAKILDANVTTAKLADSAVTTAKIADATITRVKFTGGTGTFSFGGTASAGVTNVLGSYTFSGRPFLIIINPSGASVTPNSSITINTASSGTLLTIPLGTSDQVKYFTSHATGAHDIRLHSVASNTVTLSFMIIEL